MRMSEYFLALAGHKQYDVMSAQRGPDQHRDGDGEFEDSPCYQLKKLLTGRLRHIIWDMSEQECFSGDYTGDTLDDAGLDSIREWVRRAYPEDTRTSSPTWHYLKHILDAVMHTVDHTVWGGHGHKIEEAIREAFLRADRYQDAEHAKRFAAAIEMDR